MNIVTTTGSQLASHKKLSSLILISLGLKQQDLDLIKEKESAHTPIVIGWLFQTKTHITDIVYQENYQVISPYYIFVVGP